MLRLLAPAAVLFGLLALGAAPAAANHVGCGDVITQDTTLDEDLVDCPGSGIVIGADDITVDLNGHTISGTGATGFAYAGVDLSSNNATVRDGAVRGFEHGVQISCNNNLVRSVSASNNELGVFIGV